jgi:translation initiation factor 2B subunit (eIF-2B alpha/beta/delta family)
MSDIIASCEHQIGELETSLRVPDIDKRSRQQMSRLLPDDRLMTSGIFYDRISGSRSAGRSHRNAALWILHLLKMENVEDALNLANRVLQMRPFPSARTLVPIVDKLSPQSKTTRQERIDQAIEILEGFLTSREQAERILETTAHENLSLGPDDSILVFGYSDAVKIALRQPSGRRSRPSQTVHVAQVGTRSDTDEGIQYALAIRNLKYRTFFINESAASRLLAEKNANGKPKVSKVLMGFKLLSREGVVNTGGALQLAQAARHGGVELTFIGHSDDFWSHTQWQAHRAAILAEKRNGVWIHPDGRSVLAAHKIDFTSHDYASDVIPWEYVDYIVTDRGRNTRQQITDLLRESTYS